MHIEISLRKIAALVDICLDKNANIKDIVPNVDLSRVYRYMSCHAQKHSQECRLLNAAPMKSEQAVVVRGGAFHAYIYRHIIDEQEG